MESWRWSPRYFETIHHLLSMELLPTNLNLCHLPLSIAPHMCFVPQLKRCFYVSFRELILWSLRWSIPVEVSRSSVLVLGEDLESKVVKFKMMQWINIFDEGSWIVKIVIACVPLSSYLTTWISGRDSCLVGVSCNIPNLAIHLD
jgi:hypothetical protein